MLELWYKDAIVYELDVKTYQDSDGDGVGDFQGLIQRLPHIAGLGVTCIWLRPFYPSPNRDDGYDVSDYYSIDSRLGTLGDFVQFMGQARERGIRVLADLVVNHTSDQHPWFQSAREDPKSEFRDYYVWSKEKPADATAGIVFPGVQKSTWTYDRSAKAYYHHQFYEHQPDLNIPNPKVRDEIRKIMGFWLELGLSGFRVDAAPFLTVPENTNRKDAVAAHDYLEEFRLFLSWHASGSIMLAEANVSLEETMEYFGDPQIHMLFNFLVNQRLFLALARKNAKPLIEILKKMPRLPITGQWAHFLRNHDELDLGRLDEQERADVYEAFGPKPNMQIYERGIRRRLAPMLDGDRNRLEMVYSLLFSLPGTPVLRYGCEIGMGDDLSLPERFSVRTPMQWSSESNAGFSSASADQLIRPVIRKGKFSYKSLNVADQQRDPDSFLNWVEHMIRVRKECPEFGRGNIKLLKCGKPSVLLHLCELNGGAVVAVHNFSDRPAHVQVDLDELECDCLLEILGDRAHQVAGATTDIELDAYGYRWLRVAGTGWRQV